MKARKIFLILAMFLSGSLSAQWESLNELPFLGRHHGIGFSLGGYGYMLTGSAGDYTKDLLKYDPVNDEWEDLGDYPGAFRSFSIGDVWNGKGYFGFGITSMGLENDMWEFDPVTETFTELTPCPCEARTHPAFVVSDGKIYMGLGYAFGNLGDWWVYDIDTDTWAEKATFPGSNRHHPYQFAIDGIIYVGSGHFEDWYKYDPSSNTWAQIADMPSYTKVAGIQSSYNGKGYVLSGVGHLDGGQHNPMPTGEFWEYDPALDSWTEMPPHPGQSKWASTSFIIDGFLYMVSGDDQFDQEVFRYFLGEAVSVDENIEEEKLLISPNPFSDLIRVGGLNHMKNVSYTIADMNGRTILKNKLMANSIDLSSLNNGLYMLSIESDQYNHHQLIMKE